MAEINGNAKPFGVVGLVISILSFMFSLIPCIGFYALGPCLIGLVFSILSYVNEKDPRRKNGIPLAGLIIGGLAICSSLFQYYQYKSVYDTKTKIENKLKDIEERTEGESLTGVLLEEMMQEIEEEFENDTGVTIDTTSANTLDSIEIEAIDTIQ